MKKYIISLLIAVALLATTNVVLANNQQSPFTLLWNAIAYLQEQIDNIELTPGPQGEQGIQGIQGEQGPAGELPIGFLPAPAFDSGWIELPNHGTVIDISHGVGGDYNDYFIYASYRRPAENGTLKSHQTAADVIWWEDIESNNIQIVTNGDVTNNFDAARIRIWVIQ